jgi:hypothetical protein
MAQYRKTVFSLGGPERIADPGDDVMLELGRQALARQQAEAQNAIARARLGMDAQQQAADMDFRERTLAAQLGQQSAAASGLVYDPSTGGYATDPNTGDYLKTQDSHALALQLGRAQREQEEAAWSQQMAERNFSAEDRRAQEARAHQMLLAKMQDETQQKRIDLSERTARQREDAAWDRQVKRDEDLLKRDEKKAELRAMAEATERGQTKKDKAQETAAMAAGILRQRLRGVIPDDPDVEAFDTDLNQLTPWQQRTAAFVPFMSVGRADIETARSDSNDIRAIRDEIVNAFAGNGNYAVVSPEEVDATAQALRAAVDAEFDARMQEQKEFFGIDNTAELKVARQAARELVDREAAAARARFLERAIGTAASAMGVQ